MVVVFNCGSVVGGVGVVIPVLHPVAVNAGELGSHTNPPSPGRVVVVLVGDGRTVVLVEVGVEVLVDVEVEVLGDDEVEALVEVEGLLVLEVEEVGDVEGLLVLEVVVVVVGQSVLSGISVAVTCLPHRAASACGQASGGARLLLSGGPRWRGQRAPHALDSRPAARPISPPAAPPGSPSRGRSARPSRCIPLPLP